MACTNRRQAHVQRNWRSLLCTCQWSRWSECEQVGRQPLLSHNLSTNGSRVNSKAQLRVSLDQLLPLLPSVLHDGIRKSPHYAARTNSLLIQSDESRKQLANKETCYSKLQSLVEEVYQKSVPGETSAEQHEHVKKLQKADNENRLKMKKIHSSKKAARKGGGDD